VICTEKEVASLLKLSLPSIQRMRREHGLSCLKLGRKRWYDYHVLMAELEDVPNKPSPE